MKIVIGADCDGFNLKEEVKKYLEINGVEVEDLGVDDNQNQTPYYQTASAVAKKVANKDADRGILVCWTGMGMAIIANKYPQVYAAVCENVEAAKKARAINNSNVLTLGELVTPPEVAKEIVEVWLKTEFTEGWEGESQEWLENSLYEIALIEKEQFKSQ